MNEELKRLEAHRERKTNWKNWGPYLSERAWGTVRESMNSDEDVWTATSHEKARTHVNRWNEDGLAGISDRFQHICFAFALWNGQDPILKERLFGLSGPEGNHGEDVKECYYYLDSTPTHSYMKMLYKYPQKTFPYAELVRENQKRNRKEREYELQDTGVFENNTYFDLFFEYAKAAEDELCIQTTIYNRGGEAATLYILPTIWLRNTWDWGYPNGPTGDEPGKPQLAQGPSLGKHGHIQLTHPVSGNYSLLAEDCQKVLFTNNEVRPPFTKDAFHRYLIHKEKGAVNPKNEGTKGCFLYQINVEAGGQKRIKLFLTRTPEEKKFKQFAQILEKRQKEADLFYADIQEPHLSDQLKKIQRQAFAGMLWNKQFYYLDQLQWLSGDPNYPRKQPLRNQDWEHFAAFDVLSMPDKWEYPYFCSWDSAFHALVQVMVDPDFAKRQMQLLSREWYMHPNGQIPAYEWCFSDVNPPVQAWATWRVYKIDAKMYGKADRAFLVGMFHKLLLNFTWWVNKKDAEGLNVFQGGFLGMDNISVFDRSKPGFAGRIDQADGSSWMAFFCIVMMKIALHLSDQEPVYQDMASKFFEHFLRISAAMSNCGGKGYRLWNDEDRFFYDVLHTPEGKIVPLKVRSLVGLLPLLAVETVDDALMKKNPTFLKRLEWLSVKRPHITCNLAAMYKPGEGKRRLLAILKRENLEAILHYMLDENEFLSPYGIRSISKYHAEHPFRFSGNGETQEVRYSPGDSENGLFGGNSNWRGPIWFPINYLLIESLQKFYHYYGDELQVECPTGSGKKMNLKQVAEFLSKRLITLFMPDAKGKRPIYTEQDRHQYDPHFKENLLFHEFFHGDSGQGLGASHQTGWTGLIAKLIQQSGHLFA